MNIHGMSTYKGFDFKFKHVCCNRDIVMTVNYVDRKVAIWNHKNSKYFFIIAVNYS
jgi:hypothetical protein